MISPLRIPQLVLFLSLASSALSAPVLNALGEDCDYVPSPPGYVPTCDNQGFAYAVQPHPFENQGVDFPDLSVPYFHTAKPSQYGNTRSIGLTNDSPNTPVSIYHGPPQSTTKIALNHRAYFIPTSTGDHTITVKGSDDITFCWIGPNAFNGNYNAGNTVLTVGVGIGEGTHTLHFTAGVWYPVRFLMVNGLGPVKFGFTFSGPDGKDLLSGTEKDMPWFRSHSCDGIYPAFQPWGEEKAS